MNDDEVVIIGAGICGLATALALHKKGIKSVVMERAESLRNVTGAAIGIRPNGWRALDQLGVAETLRRTAIPLQRQRVISLDGGRQKEMSLVRLEYEIRCLRRKDLIDTLYAALPLDTVKFGCQLESIKLDPHSTKPILRFIDGSSVIAKVVIGCDGGKSIVSEFLNLKPTKMFPLCAVRGLTNYPNGHSFNHEFARFMKDNVIIGRIPIDDNSVYWFCSLPFNPKDEKGWKDPEVIRQSTLELLSDFPQEIKEMIENTDMESLSFTHLRYRAPQDLLTGTFCKGTVTVAGDAMHVMGPFLGQGGSAALEDAVVLARTMAQLGLNNVGSGSKVTIHGVEKAFNQFVKQRRMRIVWLSLQTYLTGMLSGTSLGPKKILYILLLKVIFRNPNGHIDYDCGDL
ncbi:putative FAD-binding domain, FAD/NAD(P)-binding domain superfamily [Helianthus annuus]|nr:putative FAD-binding domain, FAD/NAD(P)-binding domain superfamily [Helianthus annuus]